MKDILEEIIKEKHSELDALKKSTPFKLIENEALNVIRPVISLKRALKLSPYGIIAEFKRKSPSKGWINRAIEPETVTKMYEESGASAVSVLTDSKYFGGHLDHIRRVRPLINIPILRKDFIIDPYQIAEARIAGADAILLIAAALKTEECGKLARYARSLGLEVLLEIHTADELEYVNDNIGIVGVNNRSLGTFITRVETSFELIESLPEGKIFISESGISAPDTVRRLRDSGYKGFLIGENFMRNDNPGLALKKFISEL